MSKGSRDRVTDKARFDENYAGIRWGGNRSGRRHFLTRKEAQLKEAGISVFRAAPGPPVSAKEYLEDAMQSVTIPRHLVEGKHR